MMVCVLPSPKKKRYDYRQPHNCVDCGKERLVLYKKGLPESLRCHSCAAKLLHKKGAIRYCYGADSPLWKGGRTIHARGYVAVLISPTDNYAEMRNKHNYIFEHRLVMARHLGRCLHRSELVHHKNGIKTDNRIENLELVSHLENLAYEKICRNCELRKEIRLLRWQIKELGSQLQEKMKLNV